MQTSTSGGSQDTDVNELIVNPWGFPALSVTVATAIPVAKRLHTLRKFLGSIARAACILLS
jgi:hypothetical protein